jgi:hypothetical protein
VKSEVCKSRKRLWECGSASSGADEGFEDEEDKGGGDEKVEAVHAEFVGWSEAEFRIEVLDRETSFHQSFPDCAEREILAVGGFGDFAERGFVESAADGFTVLVAEEFHPALFIGDFNFLSGRSSDANGENNDSFFGQFFGFPYAAFFKVLSVRDYNKQFAAILFIESGESLFEGDANVGAENRDGFVIRSHEGFFEGAVVESQGALEERIAGKGDEAYTARAPTPDEIENGQLGTLQAARIDIASQHAAGTIQNEDDIFAEAFLSNSLLTPLRAGEGKTDASDGDDQKDAFEPAADGAV